ncbi:hypothetical protein AWB79_05770 [Caballeronia hypogeia]|uniref:Uncharacterized protein n=1 Tax=Caballeronia hypogeia TaxID=1777140 RepID=A0A158CPZ3_9BURK|nr:hypothetical protein [Caballeronia hypogeia]SAK84423.1 hypothetical protein AWB79_05770 [Caballeronia hypogeia]
MSDTSTRSLLSGCAALLILGAFYVINAPHDWRALDHAEFVTELPLERVALNEAAATTIETARR